MIADTTVASATKEGVTMYRIMRRINLVSRCQGYFVLDRLKSADLCFSHHSYLLTVDRRPGISQEELARELCVNKSSVTRTLAHLEKHGYVERRSSEQDRRVLQVYPTEKLRQTLPQLRDVLRQWNDYLTKDFTDDEMAQFERMLDKMVERAKDYSNHRSEAMP